MYRELLRVPRPGNLLRTVLFVHFSRPFAISQRAALGRAVQIRRQMDGFPLRTLDKEIPRNRLISLRIDNMEIDVWPHRNYTLHRHCGLLLDGAGKERYCLI